MEPAASFVLQSIDAAALTPVVRRSLRRDSFQVMSWRVTQLGGGVGNPVSVGLYRFEGTGQDRDETVPWSVILKIVQSPANLGETDMGEGSDQSHWNYWKRELFAYRSGLLDTLPNGLTAPRCFGTQELPGDVAWLWLEDIHDLHGGVWPLERYALAARHLGRLNGIYAAVRPLPAFPWLGDHLIRQWLTSLPQYRPLPWDHPRLLQRYPRPELNPFRRLIVEIERFQPKLDLLPRTVCHGDTYPTNLMSVRSTGGRERTVALDWALVHIGALGDDLGQFVFGAHNNLKEASPEEITDTLFDGYVDGLRDSGCEVDRQLLCFGFVTSAALRVGLFQLVLLSQDADPSQAAPEGAAHGPAVADCFEVAMARQAFELLEAI